VRHTGEQIAQALADDHGITASVIDMTEKAGGLDNELFKASVSASPAASESWPDPVIVRVSHRSEGAPFIERVCAIHNWCVEQGLPVPEALAWGSLGDGDGYFVMPFIDAPPSIVHLFRPGRAKTFMKTFVDLQVRLHRLPATTFPGKTRSLNEILSELINAAEHLPVAAPMVEWLTRHRDEAETTDLVVCHFDYHPINVLWKWGHDPMIIDWDSAGVGPRAADVAFTAELLAMAGIVMRHRLQSTVAGVVGRRLSNSYLTRYQAELPVDPPQLRFWQVFQSANMLVWSAGGTFMDTVVREDAAGKWSPRVETIVLERFKSLTGA
jgi:aminoglycoside phosphotransferase (APT) family kinase protein